jgi:hypothetical protein
MYSRFFNAAVCVMWLLTMGWLITQKVLPTLWVGQPPSYQAIVDGQRDEPVGWSLWINDKRLGWALTTVDEQGEGPKEIRSCIHFDDLPLEELASSWGRALFRLIEQPSGRYRMDVQSVLTIDSLGKLLRFDSKIQLDPLQNILRMQGIADGQQLHVEIRSGNFSYSCDISMPQHAMLNDALSPLARLPHLAAGQSWAVPALNPLRPTASLVEVLRATVEEKEPIFWDKDIRDAWVVVYRGDPGAGFGAKSANRGKIWVLDDGTVIKQEARIFDSILRFVRLSGPETARLVSEQSRMIEYEQ